LTDYESTYGVYIAGAFDNFSISNVELYNSGNTGFYSDANQRNGVTLSGISSYSAGNYGIYLQYFDYSMFSGFRATYSSNIGIYLAACDNSAGSGFITSVCTGAGTVFSSCLYGEYASVYSYYDGAIGVRITSSTGIFVCGGGSYQAAAEMVQIDNSNYCKVTNFIGSTNRTNGYNGFVLGGANTGCAYIGCTSYAAKRHGFYSTSASNTRSQVGACQSIASSQESAGTYSNYYLQACGSGNSFFVACLSVRTASAAIWAFHGDWNGTADNET
jgi:hypothetical protein